MSATIDPQKGAKKAVSKYLLKWGGFKSVQRFLSEYSNPTTQAIYIGTLDNYLTWLRSEGIDLDPDQLIVDNLRCVYESKPTEVDTKKRHHDWLHKYVNIVMLGDEIGESRRNQVANVVTLFYRINDSELFGHFKVTPYDTTSPPDPLEADDIRKVLAALPIEQRTPLVVIWQSGVEVNRVLRLRWNQVNLDLRPAPLYFHGRKKHRKDFNSYIGKDSIDALKVWRQKVAKVLGVAPKPDDFIFISRLHHARPALMDDSWLNSMMRQAVDRLGKEGLIRNTNLRSWTTHKLRHSFKTEALHVKPEIRNEIIEFMMGHKEGIEWVYNHTNEVHPEDLEEAYLRIEPLISINPSEIVITKREEVKQRENLSELVSAEVRKVLDSLGLEKVIRQQADYDSQFSVEQLKEQRDLEDRQRQQNLEEDLVDRDEQTRRDMEKFVAPPLTDAERKHLQYLFEVQKVRKVTGEKPVHLLTHEEAVEKAKAENKRIMDLGEPSKPKRRRNKRQH